MSGTAPDRRGRVAGAVFSAIFLLIGGGLLIPFFLVPVAEVWQARRWDQRGCTIVSSRVAGDGDTHSVEVRYRYENAGVAYTGTRAQFMGGASSGREDKQRVVDGLVPGSTVLCWVDPRRPDQSVLDRGLTGDMWFGLIPGSFAVFGVLGLYFCIRGRPAGDSRWAAAASAGALPPEARVGSEPRVLKPEYAPIARFVATAAMALFWNGLTHSLLVGGVIDGWRTGRQPILMTVFALPFVGMGVVLVVKAVRALLALWNPRAICTLRPGRLVAGERAELDWVFTGSIDQLRRLTITLEGREKTPSTEGPDKSTVFATFPIHSEELMGTARQGSVRFQVPAGAPASSSSANPKIVWVVKLHGEIPGWADFEEEFPVWVLAADA